MSDEFSVPPSIADEVTSYLMRQLFTGEKYQPETFIREADVADELHVSRSPVREALKSLESHGMVKCLPRRGAVVLGYSAEEINEIYDVRLLLEMKIYTRIVNENLLTEEHYTRLMQNLESLEKLSQTSDEGSLGSFRINFFNLDSDFHFYIHDLAGLPWTAELLQKTYSRLYQFRIRHIGREDLTSLVKSHSEILEYLKSGDLDALRQLRVDSYETGKSVENKN